LMSVGERRPAAPAAADLALEDRWILSRMEAVTADVDDAMTEWDLGRIARALFHFAWDEYCDWYLELAKLRVHGHEGADADTDADAARWTLIRVLGQIMLLLHPLMPFLTEEIWRVLHNADDGTTIQRAAWPQPGAGRRDTVAEAQFEALVEAVTELRRFRADHALPPAARMSVIAHAEAAQRDVFSGALDGIRRLTGVDDWRFVDRVDDVQGPFGRVPMTSADLYVPLTGLVDLDEERARLQRELDRAQQEAARAKGKLTNEGFVNRAPPEVVQNERDKMTEWEAAIRRLVSQLETLSTS